MSFSELHLYGLHFLLFQPFCVSHCIYSNDPLILTYSKSQSFSDTLEVSQHLDKNFFLTYLWIDICQYLSETKNTPCTSPPPPELFTQLVRPTRGALKTRSCTGLHSGIVHAQSLKIGEVFWTPPIFFYTAGLFNWSWCFYLQRSKELVFPVCGIFFI